MHDDAVTFHYFTVHKIYSLIIKFATIGGTRMATEEADKDAGLVPSRAKSPGRSALPAPRSSGLPRPSSSNKLTNSSENIASNGDVKRWDL